MMYVYLLNTMQIVVNKLNLSKNSFYKLSIIKLLYKLYINLFTNIFLKN